MSLRKSLVAVILSLFVAVVLVGMAEAAEMAEAVSQDGSGSSADMQYCDPLPDQPDPPAQPVVSQHYTAKVEVVRAVLEGPSSSPEHIVTYVEYAYDGPGRRLSVEISSKQVVEKYILNWNSQQMMVLRSPKDDSSSKRECLLWPLEEATYLFSVLWGSNNNISTDTMLEPAVPLGILHWSETHYKGNYQHRGMASYRWDWCGLKQFEADAATPNISMATYWSASTWRVATLEISGVSWPLGWEVEMHEREGDTTKLEVHNVMYYNPGIVDYTAFTVPQDMYCPTLTPEPPHSFPDFSMDRLFTFSLEMRQTDVQDFTWADGWYDFEKQLYRIDHDVILDKKLVTTTEVFDFNDGVEYSFPLGSLAGCTVNIINNSHTDWADITGISLLWADNPNAFFGTNATNYVYYGPGVVRVLAGQEWRGERSDWPTGADAITLWQWTFTDKNVTSVTVMGDHLVEERKVPVGLRVTALQDINIETGVLQEGSALVYQLYDFNMASSERADTIYTDVANFDTYYCYSANWRDHLKFKLDVSAWPEVVNTPLLTSSRFNEHWQMLLAQFGQVSVSRITRVKSINEASGEVWVQFVLLYRHPSISQLDPDLYVHMTSGLKAKDFITVAVNYGSINYHGYKPDGQAFMLVAVPGSLSPVIEPDCTITTSTSTTESRTTTTTTTTTTTPDHGTTTTTPDHGTTTTKPSYTDQSTTTPTTTSDPNNPNQTLYTSGDLAGVGIGLLLIGLAVGTCGTFLVVVKKIHLTVVGWFKA